MGADFIKTKLDKHANLYPSAKSKAFGLMHCYAPPCGRITFIELNRDHDGVFLPQLPAPILF
ncbi:MAG: hypothetical protein D6813_05830 [Calditrichaeota bacterium]|nr:MAG: hypothetical protein D6813_05830 [Calditrichota bacterium]